MQYTGKMASRDLYHVAFIYILFTITKIQLVDGQHPTVVPRSTIFHTDLEKNISIKVDDMENMAVTVTVTNSSLTTDGRCEDDNVTISPGVSGSNTTKKTDLSYLL